MSATLLRHRSKSHMSRSFKRRIARVNIPTEQNEVVLEQDGRVLKLTNLQKPFWTNPRITKGRLLQYYADVAPYLLPHLRDRAMVMKRYPNGASGAFFFMKRVPEPPPNWLNQI